MLVTAMEFAEFVYPSLRIFTMFNNFLLKNRNNVGTANEQSRHEQYHFFYPNTNTQYFQRGSNNTQYQYQFFEEALTIPNTNTNIHEGS